MAKKKLNAAMILAAGADAPLKENKTKSKTQYDRISLATTPAQKMQLKQKAEDADEVSLSRFIIKVLKKHGYLD
jgi:hypothetical protein